MDIESDEEDEQLETRKRAFTMNTVNSFTPQIRLKAKDDTFTKPTTDAFRSMEKLFTEAKERTLEDVNDEVFFENTFKKLRHFKISGLLEKHDVTERLRAKMMDWMIEVLKIYQ